MSRQLAMNSKITFEVDNKAPEPRPAWLPILMYHRVVNQVDGSDPSNLCVSTVEFEAQMRFLRDRGYRSISFEELALTTVHGSRPREKRVIITFDDGYRDFYDHALPILRRYQQTATLFLVSSSIGGLNSWDRGQAAVVPLLGMAELNEARKYGIDFGSHSSTHPRLPDLDRRAAEKEILDSKAALERLLGSEVRSFCFPYGQSSPVLSEMVKNAGYVAACGVEQREHSLFNLSRVDVPTCHGSPFLWRWKVSGLHYRMRQQRVLRKIKALATRASKSGGTAGEM